MIGTIKIMTVAVVTYAEEKRFLALAERMEWGMACCQSPPTEHQLLKVTKPKDLPLVYVVTVTWVNQLPAVGIVRTLDRGGIFGAELMTVDQMEHWMEEGVEVPGLVLEVSEEELMESEGKEPTLEKVLKEGARERGREEGEWARTVMMLAATVPPATAVRYLSKVEGFDPVAIGVGMLLFQAWQKVMEETQRYVRSLKEEEDVLGERGRMKDEMRRMFLRGKGGEA